MTGKCRLGGSSAVERGGGVFTRDGGFHVWQSWQSQALHEGLAGWRLAFPNARSLLWGGGNFRWADLTAQWVVGMLTLYCYWCWGMRDGLGKLQGKDRFSVGCDDAGVKQTPQQRQNSRRESRCPISVHEGSSAG